MAAICARRRPRRPGRRGVDRCAARPARLSASTGGGGAGGAAGGSAASCASALLRPLAARLHRRTSATVIASASSLAIAHSHGQATTRVLLMLAVASGPPGRSASRCRGAREERSCRGCRSAAWCRSVAICTALRAASKACRPTARSEVPSAPPTPPRRERSLGVLVVSGSSSVVNVHEPLYTVYPRPLLRHFLFIGGGEGRRSATSSGQQACFIQNINSCLPSPSSRRSSRPRRRPRDARCRRRAALQRAGLRGASRSATCRSCCRHGRTCEQGAAAVHEPPRHAPRRAEVV